MRALAASRSRALVVCMLCIAGFLGASSAWALTAELEAKLQSPEGGLFGRTVALDGNTLVIGAPVDGASGPTTGAAFVFTRTGGVWTEQAKLLAADGSQADWFGWSVALDGDTAVIGAKWDDDYGERSGSAYVFTRTGGVWTEQAKLLAANGAPFDYLGYSVAVDGNTAVISAYLHDDNGLVSQGAVYVFTREGGVWTEQAQLLASDGADHDNFGYSVAVQGDEALIGSVYDDDDVIGPGAGSVYVFKRTGGVWSEQDKLQASDGEADDHLGQVVTLHGDSAVFGAQQGHGGSGKAYVFARTGGLWTEQAKLLASDAAGYDEFGDSVAIDGDIAVIGAWADDDNGVHSGSAYVYVRMNGIWTEAVKLLAPDGETMDVFGMSVAVEGDTVVIGARGDDGLGSAYVYRLTPDSAVPATGGTGIVLLLLAMSGCGLYFLGRRRSIP